MEVMGAFRKTRRVFGGDGSFFKRSQNDDDDDDDDDDDNNNNKNNNDKKNKNRNTNNNRLRESPNWKNVLETFADLQVAPSL